ncbi:MAG: phosphoribosylglycinamide formyltransferase [Actinomycetota bacterium]
MDARIAVLASGTGSNLQALLDNELVGPALALVVSDRAEAKALDRARSAAVEAVHLDPKAFAGRDEHDRALTALLQERDIQLVCLAGYMRILSADFVRAFWGKTLNVHPSLLPAFPGAHAVGEALAWGAKITGCTVHLVDEEVDHGPILAQESVPILEDDDESSLHARIQEAEHRLYPRVVGLMLQGKIRIDGRAARLEEDR